MKDRYVILEKLEDLKYGGNHPNSINVGYRLEGWCISEPVLGEQLFLFMSKDIDVTPSCWTSRLVNIDLEGMLLETANSKYKISFDEETESITLKDIQKALNKKR